MSKTILKAAVALSLLCGTRAFAQHDEHHDAGGPAPHDARGEPHTGGGARPQAYPSRGAAYSPGGQYPRGTSGQAREGAAVAAVAAGAGGRGAPLRYSERAFPRAVQPERQYHWRGAWNPPPGFYYRHWNYGDRLPFGWFARDFWITNFWFYGLPPAPYGYAWVREGPDALLVNVYTGAVVEVEYGLFY